jgi:hypothetical protein
VEYIGDYRTNSTKRRWQLYVSSITKKNVFFNVRWNVLSNWFLRLSTLEDLIDRHEYPI